MNKVTILLISLLMMTVSAFADNDRITHDVKELPAESQQFLSKYFKGQPISHIKIEKGLMLIDNYDVILTDGTQIEFERSGAWKEVKGKPSSLPAAIIPAFVKQYVKQHYEGAEIKGIDRSSRHYEIDLTNGFELKFDQKGNIVDIDH